MAEQTSPSPDATRTTLTSNATSSKAAQTVARPGLSEVPDPTELAPEAAKADPMPKAAQPDLTPDQIEAEIATTRAHLAKTIDELTIRSQPREIVRRQKEAAKARFVEATHTPEGDLRLERIGAMAAAGAAVLLVLAILHRRHHRG